MILTLVAVVTSAIVGLLYMFPWLLDDFKQLSHIIPNQLYALRMVHKHQLFINLWEHNSVKYASRTLLIYGDRKFTYSQMDERMTQVANAAVSLGLKCDDCVALFMYNSPDFFCFTYGLFKVGVRVALLNTNIRQQSLLHCIDNCKAKVIICGNDEELVGAVCAISKDLPDVQVWVNCSEKVSVPAVSVPDTFTCIGDEIDQADGKSFDKSVRSGVNCHKHGTVAYIFTSGTTGLVKAVSQTNYRLFGAASVARFCRNLGEKDVIYAPLPMYHSLGLLLSFGTAVFSGSTFLTRKKFSASAFWEDCSKHHVTTVVYIGEMLRYLLNQPENANIEKSHSIEIAIGNGLRQDIWRSVQQRFSIPRIQEFFAATEGNVGFVNTDNVEGAVGRLSPITGGCVQGYLIKYDHQNDLPYRDNRGHCVQVKQGEPGLLITKVTKITPFAGYYGNRQSEMNSKKLLRNVFGDNSDVYVNFGDLLYCDSRYNLYFADRVGDTFRWKSENVSTTEVSNIICLIDWIQDCAVYGVLVPGCEGRAGMAAIQTKVVHKLSSNQLQQVYTHCSQLLPVYARPVFVRVQTLNMTETFKQKKVNLVSEGFDPSKIADPLYFYNATKKTYVELSDEMFMAINGGHVRM